MCFKHIFDVQAKKKRKKHIKRKKERKKHFERKKESYL